MSSLHDLERAFVRLCCEPALRAPAAPLGPGHARIWGIYRNMVRNRFLDEAKFGLKRTLKTVGEPACVGMLSRLMHEAPPRSRAVYAIVPELAAFAAPLWSGDATVPSWASDLIRYEALRYHVADVLADRTRAAVELDFERVPVMHEAITLMSCDYRVHRDPEPDGSYVKAKTELAIYRAKDERTVSAYVLSAFSADCIRAWQRGVSVSQSVRDVAQARGVQPDAKRIDALCTVLSDFIERGVVLGSAPT